MKRVERSLFVSRLVAVLMLRPSLRNLGRPAIGLMLTLILLPGMVYLLAETLRKPSTFHIAANTEVLDMVTTKVSATRWYVQEAEAMLGAADPLSQQSLNSFEFSGLVEIGPRSNVRMVRYGNGPLHITLYEPDSTELQPSGAMADVHSEVQEESARQEAGNLPRAIPVVTLENLLTEKSMRWADSAAFTVRMETLPFNGSLLAIGAIGSETYAAAMSEPPPVLREGRVIMMEKRLLSDLRYPVMELDLQLGDEVSVLSADGTPADTACVFSVAASTTPGIGVACHASGKTLQISRFGGHVVRMEPGPWDMILAEPTLQAMVPVMFSVIYVSLQWLLKFILPRRDASADLPPGT